MNDLISRSKLDKKLCEKKAMYTSVATKEAFDKTISIVWEMPDETGWISVDDRLPEIERNVLIVTKSTYSGSLRVNQAFYENGEIGECESDRLFLHLRPDIYEYMKDQMTNWKEYFTCAIIRHTTLAGMEAIEDKELEEPFKIEVIWLKEGE